jgi:hypothetical protein
MQHAKPLADVTFTELMDQRYHIGVFMTRYHDSDVLATFPKMLTPSWGEGYTTTMLNRELENQGFTKCDVHVSHQIFRRTYFARFGHKAESRMTFRNFPQRFLADSNYNNRKPVLTTILDEDRDITQWNAPAVNEDSDLLA